MKDVGVGYNALEKCCGYVWKQFWQVIVENATKVVAGSSKKRFCCWVKEGSDVSDVSVGGTWQWLGYSLLNGIVAAISMDIWIVLDSEVRGCYCKGLNKLKEELWTSNIEHMKFGMHQMIGI